MKPDLLYNFGVNLLNLKRPKEAFTYLNICLSHYYNNPRLWLRVAECCMQIYKSVSKKPSSFTHYSLWYIIKIKNSNN